MPILGIDIGRNRFRIVEIEREKDSSVLTNYGAYDGPELNLSFGSEELVKNYAQVLKEFISDHDFSTSNAVVALPEQDVFIRVIKTPVMDVKELRNFISLGAEEYIPIPITEVTFDAQIIGTKEEIDSVVQEGDVDLSSVSLKDLSEKGEEIEKKPTNLLDKNLMSVLLVASKNDVLNKYVGLLKQAGLTPRGIEPETLSVERVLGDTAERPNASLIVNIGALSTQLIITYKGFVRFTRSVSVGGDELTKAIERELNLDHSQAEEYKKAYGLDEGQLDGKVFNAIRPVFDQIILEINRSKMYYTTHSPNVIINRVVLTGGTTLMPGLLAYIVNKLDVEAELANPWRNVKLSQKIEHSRDELMNAGPLYSTAVGLGLKEV